MTLLIFLSVVLFVLDFGYTLQEAYSEFLTQLPIDEDGDYVYPSTFSGAYLDEETYALCIALTDCSDDVQEQYDHFFSDPSIVVYKEAEPFRKL